MQLLSYFQTIAVQGMGLVKGQLLFHQLLFSDWFKINFNIFEQQAWKSVIFWSMTDLEEPAGRAVKPQHNFSSSDKHHLSAVRKSSVFVCRKPELLLHRTLSRWSMSSWCALISPGSHLVHKAAVGARLLAALLNEAADPLTCNLNYTHTYCTYTDTHTTKQPAEVRGCEWKKITGRMS